MFIRKIDCLHMQDKLDRLCPMSRAKNEFKKLASVVFVYDIVLTSRISKKKMKWTWEKNPKTFIKMSIPLLFKRSFY